VKRLIDILEKVAAGLLVALITWVAASADVSQFIPILGRLDFNIALNLVSVGFALLLLVSMFVYLLMHRRPLRVFNGRRSAMESNVSLLRKRPSRNRAKHYIWSTRVSFWPAAENEPVRKEFRNLLAQRIGEGFEVRRIWQIHGSEDWQRLLHYLEEYRNYDNYSVKCFIGKSAYIPEILSVGGKYLSVAIPQTNDPNKLTTAFQFRGKYEIERWESYFTVLWEQSTPIKIARELFTENINRLTKQIANQD